jgi:hypothetical protein
VCAGGSKPHKGMQDADAWLEHKTILNLARNVAKQMGSRHKVCLHAPLGLALYLCRYF